MLVIFSFGLVLLATILLVVGLLSDSLPFIYLSIVSSVAAAVVLFVAFRAARPKPHAEGEQPEPLEESPVELADAEADAVKEREPVAAGATSSSASATATIPAVATPDDDWLDDEEWDDGEVVDFPIADYDDLTVAEIMPLLPQLYSDELDTVIDRERSGRNRSTIINRLEELKVSGTEADAADAEPLDDEDIEADASEPAQDDYAAPRAASALADDDDDDWFPIADYDDLSVRQIVPLLPQLEEDELEDVRAREASGPGRKTVLAEIDRLIAGEESAPARSTTRPAPKPAKRASRGERFPIANYDDLGVRDIRPRLSSLSSGQLAQVLERERAGAARSSIISEIEKQLGDTAGTPRASTAKKAPAKKAPAKKAPAKKSASRARGAAKRTARFPIANYDEIGVREIRPRLARLNESQLQQVLEREQAGKARNSIIEEINKRLG